MNRSLFLSIALLIIASVVPLLGQGMAAKPPSSPAPLEKVTRSSVWQPPQDFLAKAHSVCDKSMTAMSFPECFMNQIAVAGAPPDAVSFTRMLYQQSDGQVGIMSAFKSYGVVDAAQVFYPLRANDNYGLLLVNGDPEILDVDDLKKLDQVAMEQSSGFQALKKKYPQVDVWPGDRSGVSPWPRVQPLPDGGKQFIVSYPLINGCHACARVGAVRFAWNFDVSGKFLHTAFSGTGKSQSRSEPSSSSLQ